MSFNDVVKQVQGELIFNDSSQIGSEGRRQDLEVRFEIGAQIEDVIIGKKDAPAFRSFREIAEVVSQPFSIFGAHIVIPPGLKLLQ
jgi:hypothetical protein